MATRAIKAEWDEEVEEFLAVAKQLEESLAEERKAVRRLMDKICEMHAEGERQMAALSKLP